MINKVGGTVERVNGQLDKLDVATDSAVDAVASVDTAVRAVSHAVVRPVQRATGLATGVAHGVSALKVRRNWRDAVATGKAAAARREADFAEEIDRP